MNGDKERERKTKSKCGTHEAYEECVWKYRKAGYRKRHTVRMRQTESERESK